jgi:hypothetical protein
MSLVRPPERTVHRADCSIWDTPADAAPEALIVAGIEDEAVIRYCGAARPVYDAFKRVLGQLSGILLLAETGADDPAWRDGILDAAGDQVAAARERLGALRPASPVARHYDSLAALAERIGRLHGDLRPRRLEVGGDADLEPLVRELFAIHRQLLAASEPRAGMTPVDFSHACCSCGVPSKLLPAPQDKNR